MKASKRQTQSQLSLEQGFIKGEQEQQQFVPLSQSQPQSQLELQLPSKTVVPHNIHKKDRKSKQTSQEKIQRLNDQSQQRGLKKSISQADTQGFICLLIYSLAKGTLESLINNRYVSIYLQPKGFTILIFYNYDNYLLRHKWELLPYFVFLLIVNAYYMLTTGKQPGFYPNGVSERRGGRAADIQINSSNIVIQIQMAEQDSLLKTKHARTLQQECITKNSTESAIKNGATIRTNLSLLHSESRQIASADKRVNIPDHQEVLDYSPSENPNSNFCKFCQIQKRNRMSHCYSCGKCIMKKDHHCPWINGCVGELNHFKFVCSLFFHTCQSTITFYIVVIQCYKSLDYYKYYSEEDQSFSLEFGIFAMWAIFMFMYILFSGGLFCFHLYLVASNQTTKQLVSRQKCAYLRNLKDNPFSEGLLGNLKYAMFPDKQGREWKIYEQTHRSPRQRTCCEKVWSNEYYECC